MSAKSLGCGLATIVVLQLCGCKAAKKWEDKMEAKRIEMRDAATACAAPATCSDKHRGDGGHDFKVCSALPADFALGDVVLVKELGGLAMIATVKGPKGKGYGVEFADGNTLERAKPAIVYRVCN